MWFFWEPGCFLQTYAQVVPTEPLRSVNDAVMEPSFSKELPVDRGRQRESSKFNRQPSSSLSTQVYYRRRSFRDRVQGSSRSGKEGEVSVYWPPDVLLVHTIGSPFPRQILL